MPSAAAAFEECPQDANGLILETEEIRVHGLAEIRKLMDAHTTATEGFRYCRADDKFLLAFLRARKYKIDKAHDCLVNFSKFWFNPAYRHIIEGLDAERLRAFYRQSPAKVLEGTDRLGNALGTIEASKMAMSEDGTMMAGSLFDGQVRLSLYGLADILDNDALQLRGCTYIETFEGFSLSKAMGMSKAMSSAQQKELMSIMMDSFPIRIRSIIILHPPWYFSLVWKVAKLFFKKKIVDRVKMLGHDVSKLHELVDPAVLPPLFGGTLVEAEDAAIDRWVAKEKRQGHVGGFAVPFSVDTPTGKSADFPSIETGSAAAAASAPSPGGAGSTTGAAAGAGAVVASH